MTDRALSFRWFWLFFGHIFLCHFCEEEVVGAFSISGANRKLARHEGSCKKRGWPILG